VAATDEDKTASDNFLTFKTKEKKNSKSLELVNKVIKTDKDNSAGKLGLMVKAGILYESGKLKEAKKEYEQFLRNLDPAQKWIRANALLGLGTVLEALNEKDKAIEKYNELASLNKGKLSLIGKYESVRIADNKTKEERIKDLKDILNKIKDKGEPDSNDYLFVEARALLLDLDPSADVPDLPDSIDPGLLRQLLSAQKRKGAGALK
jgi:tetratricopeptide (TPR) repeat protein